MRLIYDPSTTEYFGCFNNYFSATEGIPTLINFRLQLVQNKVMLTYLDVFPLNFLKTTISEPCVGLHTNQGSKTINALIEIDNKAFYRIKANYTDYDTTRHTLSWT